MTSKERVLTAVNLEQPDRIPMDYHGNRFVLERLRGDLGVSSHRELLEALGSDVVDLRGTVDPAYAGPIPASREIDNLMLGMAAVPDMTNCLMDRFTDFCLEYFDRMLTADGEVRRARAQPRRDRHAVPPAARDSGRDRRGDAPAVRDPRRRGRSEVIRRAVEDYLRRQERDSTSVGTAPERLQEHPTAR
jgi:hypothetical protein